MIISISGKAGSGKDTVGKIIQDLTKEDWQIKKYSDKLKDIVCILIGCTREQLEDQEFKETPLGENWWYYSHSNGTFLIPYDGKGDDTYLVKLTPRMILQLIGTEGGRDLIHPDIWVNALYSDYRPLSYEKDSEGRIETVEEKWIITDSRFPNDVKRTREIGGILIRVNRAECEGRENEHASETALDDFNEWDHVIENNGTIEELIEQVRTIFKEEGIIKKKE